MLLKNSNITATIRTTEWHTLHLYRTWYWLSRTLQGICTHGNSLSRGMMAMRSSVLGHWVSATVGPGCWSLQAKNQPLCRQVQGFGRFCWSLCSRIPILSSRTILWNAVCKSDVTNLNSTKLRFSSLPASWWLDKYSTCQKNIRCWLRH